MCKRVAQLPALLAVLILGSIFSTVAQTEKESGSYLLKINITQQPDSPVSLTLDSIRCANAGPVPVSADNRYPKQPETVMLRLKNVSGSPVIAYALVSRGKWFHNVQVNTFTKGLLPGDNLLRGFGTGDNEEIEYSIDYVLFEGGSAWGADSFGRSRQIALYLSGRNAAIEQLRKLAASYPNPQNFIDWAFVFGGAISHDPAGPPNPQTLEHQFRDGWTLIIDMLRNNPNRNKESNELADSLEASIPK